MMEDRRQKTENRKSKDCILSVICPLSSVFCLPTIDKLIPLDTVSPRSNRLHNARGAMPTDIIEVEAASVKHRSATGLTDLLPDSLRYWRHIEQIVDSVANSFGFRQIVLPQLDPASAYTEALGESFLARTVETNLKDHKEKYVMRAHPRIGVLRSFLENNLYDWPPPVRLAYKPEVVTKIDGVLSHQRYICLDCLGAKDGITNASMLVVLRKLDEALHVKKSKVSVHSIGCSDCRPAYEIIFQSYATDRKSELCPTCAVNPNFATLATCNVDAESGVIMEAPSILDHLCVPCHSAMASLLESCDDLDVTYNIDQSLYTADPEAEQTAFAIRFDGEPRPAIIGYNFNKFATSIVGQPLNAIGVTIDMQRLANYLETGHATLSDESFVKIFVAQLGPQAKICCVPLLQSLFNAGYSAVFATESESITQQLQVAARLNARITLIVGQKEAVNGHVILRDMASGLQDNVIIEELLPILKERLAIVP